MREVNTKMRLGSPISAGTSKASRPRTSTMSTTDATAGSINGTVTVRKVWNGFAPLMLADSSSDASINLNAEDTNRKTSGDDDRPSTQIMPPRLYTLNGAAGRPRPARSAALIAPVCGLNQKIQAMVMTMPG